MAQYLSDYCTVDGPGMGELRPAIVGAFDAGDLDELIRFTFSEGLYQTYVPRGLNDNELVFQLLVELGKRGTTAIFLRAVRKARPKEPALVELIRRLCPAALNEADAARVAVTHVIAALEVMKTRISDPGVRLPLHSSREDLTGLVYGFARLKAYKILHDCLQRVQVQLHSQPLILKTWRTDPLASSTLEAQVLQLNMYCEDARAGVQELADTPLERRMEIRRVVEPLASATSRLHEAIALLDDRAAALAVNAIRDLIRNEPPRINSLLTATAESLPIDQLIAAIEHVQPNVEAEAYIADTLSGAAAGLQNLFPRLRGHVTEHALWQDIENILWGADQTIGRASFDSMEDFVLYWLSVKPLISKIWHMNPEASWVQQSQKSAAECDRALPPKISDITPAAVNEIRGSYNRFRHQTLLQFYKVDHALNALCGEIVAIGRPLSALLSEVPNGN